MESEVMTGVCPLPGCGKEVYLKFVFENGTCPACGQAVEVQNLLPPKPHKATSGVAR